MDPGLTTNNQIPSLHPYQNSHTLHISGNFWNGVEKQSPQSGKNWGSFPQSLHWFGAGWILKTTVCDPLSPRMCFHCTLLYTGLTQAAIPLLPLLECLKMATLETDKNLGIRGYFHKVSQLKARQSPRMKLNYLGNHLIWNVSEPEIVTSYNTC